MDTNEGPLKIFGNLKISIEFYEYTFGYTQTKADNVIIIFYHFALI